MRNLTFKPFRCKGRQFLAIFNSNGAHIIDDQGNNYGSVMDIKWFKDRYKLIAPDAMILGRYETLCIIHSDK